MSPKGWRRIPGLPWASFSYWRKRVGGVYAGEEGGRAYWGRGFLAVPSLLSMDRKTLAMISGMKTVQWILIVIITARQRAGRGSFQSSILSVAVGENRFLGKDRGTKRVVFLWLNLLSSQRVRDYTVRTQLSGRLKYPERSHVLDICRVFMTTDWLIFFHQRLVQVKQQGLSRSRVRGFDWVINNSLLCNISNTAMYRYFKGKSLLFWDVCILLMGNLPLFALWLHIHSFTFTVHANQELISLELITAEDTGNQRMVIQIRIHLETVCLNEMIREWRKGDTILQCVIAITFCNCSDAVCSSFKYVENVLCKACLQPSCLKMRMVHDVIGYMWICSFVLLVWIHVGS